MYEVTQEIPFCYGHRLLLHAGKCARLHGHNGVARLTLRAAALDDGGMVVDFDQVAARVGGWIEQTLDHRMLLHAADPIIPELLRQGEPFVTVDANPTAETIARLIFERVAAQGMPVTEVTLWETENSFATYRPTPGAPDAPLAMREVAGRAS